MDTSFRLPVFRQLIVRDIKLNRQAGLIALGVLGGVITLVGLFARNIDQGVEDWQHFHIQWYGTLLFLIGALRTAGSFGEFRRSATLQDYLLLPASHLEKWISRWFRSLPFYLITFTGAYLIASLLLKVVMLAVHRENIPLFDPFDPLLLQYWKWYVLVHAVMLIGAVQFNRNPALKTVGILLAALFTFALLTGGMQYALFRDLMKEGLFSSEGSHMLSIDPEYLMNLFRRIFPWVLWLFILPLLWWISFLKLNEKEV